MMQISCPAPIFTHQYLSHEHASATFSHHTSPIFEISDRRTCPFPNLAHWDKGELGIVNGPGPYLAMS